MEHLSEEKKRQEQLDFLKSQKTCSNCVHRQVCTIVNSIMALPVNKFVVTLKQVPFYEGINKSVGENCFHFQNENNQTCMPEIPSKKEYDLVSIPMNPDTITEMKVPNVEINKEKINPGDYVRIIVSSKELVDLSIGEKYAKDLILLKKMQVNRVIKDCFINHIYKKQDTAIIGLSGWHIPISFLEKVNP